MNTLNAVKMVAGLVVSTGIGNIVGNLVKHTTPEDVKLPIKVVTNIGGFALAGFLAMKTAAYTESTIQEVVDTTKKLVNGKIVIDVIEEEPETPEEKPAEPKPEA